MAKFDRYMLSQLLVLFGFFALVLVALFWINRAVVLFDRLIGDGQSALVFLEFTSLSLPKLIVTVLPIAAFAGAVYVTNRMMSESELTVLQSTGTGPWRLALPVLAYGLCVALMMSILTHFLSPMAQTKLTQRENEISQNVTARLLTEGTFLHPAKNVTFYTRIIDAEGVLNDVFLSDRRTPDEGVIYTASEAYIVRNGQETTLIMVDGLAQRLNNKDKRLTTAKFRDFSFNISGLVNKGEAGAESVRALSTTALLTDWTEISRRTGSSTGVIAEEFHSRFAEPLFCVIAALIGFSTLMLRGYSRFGVWREVVISFGLLITVDGIQGALAEPVRADASAWPLMYVPFVIGVVLVTAMLSHASHPHWMRRSRSVGGAT